MSRRTLLLFAAAFLCALIGTAPSEAAPKASSGLLLEDLVRQVKLALLEVEQSAEAEKLPSLAKVELEVNTVQTRGGDGKLSLLVIELGSGASQELTNTVKLTLAPPSPSSTSDVSATDLANALVESILVGARAIAAAKKGTPPLLARELTVAIRFLVSRDAGGKVTVKFPPFEVGGGAKLHSSDVHEISVVYKVAPQ